MHIHLIVSGTMTRPEDTAKGTRNVVDVEFNDGSVRTNFRW